MCPQYQKKRLLGVRFCSFQFCINLFKFRNFRILLYSSKFKRFGPSFKSQSLVLLRWGRVAWEREGGADGQHGDLDLDGVEWVMRRNPKERLGWGGAGEKSEGKVCRDLGKRRISQGMVV
ncbi:hypothetical protein HKD37_08G021724 [Glycine soja]|nr:hypothetical protein JHK87_021127 [Glycine soja]